MISEYTIKDDFHCMDFNRITAMLSKSYWSPGISNNEVIQGASNSSLLVGAFNLQGNQIGYARVISDKTRFAYILDVIVDEQWRRKGIGQSMIKHILKHKSLEMVYQWLLITKDAHEVYRKTGFTALSKPEGWMEIRYNRPNR